MWFSPDGYFTPREIAWLLCQQSLFASEMEALFAIGEKLASGLLRIHWLLPTGDLHLDDDPRYWRTERAFKSLSDGFVDATGNGGLFWINDQGKLDGQSSYLDLLLHISDVQTAFGLQSSEAPKPPDGLGAAKTERRTGAAGRPSSMHLIKAEFDRRWTAKVSHPETAAEARYLMEWFEVEHPSEPPLQHKTLTNNIPGWVKLCRARKPE